LLAVVAPDRAESAVGRHLDPIAGPIERLHENLGPWRKLEHEREPAAVRRDARLARVELTLNERPPRVRVVNALDPHCRSQRRQRLEHEIPALPGLVIEVHEPAWILEGRRLWSPEREDAELKVWRAREVDVTAVKRPHRSGDAPLIRESRSTFALRVEYPQIAFQRFRIPNVRGDARAVRREREI